MTPYTDIGLQHASHDELKQGFDGDERIPGLVAKEFDDIAAGHGVSASLNVYTSSVTISADELSKLPDDEPTCLNDWLEEALERVAQRWMNDEL